MMLCAPYDFGNEGRHTDFEFAFLGFEDIFESITTILDTIRLGVG